MRDDVYAGMLVSRDELKHYGKGHDDNPPGRGSGRYPYGSGDRPHQHLTEVKNTKTFGTPERLSNYMKKHFKYAEFTTLKSPEQTAKDMSGSCHDQTLYELKELSKMGKKPKAMFVIEYDEKTGQGGMTHSFVYWKEHGSVRYLENAWGNHEGIKNFKDLESLQMYFWKSKLKGEFGDKKYSDLEFGDFNTKKLHSGMTLQELVDACLE